MKSAATKSESVSLGLAWPIGEFYVPGFSSDGRTALVPGAADSHRRLFLLRASKLETELLPSLRAADDNEDAITQWAKRWHLSDRWCVLLAQDTKRWWAFQPESRGWEFEELIAVAGHFPFRIDPLRFGPFYYDPTWRRREDFQKSVLENVRKALKNYCHEVEGNALRAGLKRAPRKRGKEHFDWLVRYQIKGESFGTIAKSSSYKVGGRQAVHKAVVDLAEYLALTLRVST